MAGDTVKTLEPTTTKEWLMHINNKLDALVKNQDVISENQTDMSSKLDTVITCQSTQDIRIDHLEKRVNGWSLTNSIGVIIAGILAALGLKG
ncbi:MAG: hypothetical protein WC428_06725 [Candidatus Paceibacterota bacterium]|jgi:hypothetical protein